MKVPRVLIFLFRSRQKKNIVETPLSPLTTEQALREAGFNPGVHKQGNCRTISPALTLICIKNSSPYRKGKLYPCDMVDPDKSPNTIHIVEDGWAPPEIFHIFE